MSSPKSPERVLCEDYCKKYPDMKSLTLAKKISQENKTKFPKLMNVERVRKNYVNTIRGLNGKKSRDLISDKSQFKTANYDTTNSKPERIETGAKILILDIETAPIRAYVWGIWNQNVSIGQIDSDWYCITWAAKWLFDKKVYSAAVTPGEAVNQDDKRIIKSLWALLNEADMVIAHNGDQFDLPRINSKFLMYGLNPPTPYQSIDTLKHIRRQFGFTSNKLDYVNQVLNLPRKMEHEGFPLWEKCYKGNSAAIKKMLAYNIADVKILEDTYLRIRAWIKPHPNLGLFILDEKASHCPSCGSAALQSEGDRYFTTANVYEVYRCTNCGGTSRKRLSSVDIKKRRHLVLSIPK